MEKIFTSLVYANKHHRDKTKICATCDNSANGEASFNVGGGITLTEIYREQKVD
jgi:hypothetical protein